MAAGVAEMQGWSGLREQIFYSEFDGCRRKRALARIIGE
jgi:hypothetical protein